MHQKSSLNPHYKVQNIKVMSAKQFGVTHINHPCTIYFILCFPTILRWTFINCFIRVFHCFICKTLSKPYNTASSRIADFFCCCSFTCPQLDITGHLPPSQSCRTKENVIQGQCQNQPDNWHERLLQPQNFPL